MRLQLFSAVSASFDLKLLNSAKEEQKFKGILCDGVDRYYYHLNKFTLPSEEQEEYP